MRYLGKKQNVSEFDTFDIYDPHRNNSVNSYYTPDTQLICPIELCEGGNLQEYINGF